jgi:hypothetical protein
VEVDGSPEGIIQTDELSSRRKAMQWKDEAGREGCGQNAAEPFLLFEADLSQTDQISALIELQRSAD